MIVRISKNLVTVITKESGIMSIKYFSNEEWLIKERKRKIKMVLNL